MRRAYFHFAWMAAFGSALGCSVINSFDSINEGSGGAAGTGGGIGGAAGGMTTGGTAGTGGVAGMPTGGTGGMAGTGGGAGMAGSGGGPTGSEGAVVVGGTDTNSMEDVVVVLDPRNGDELSREEMLDVVGVVHDPFNDVWYLFERGSTPFEDQTLHARRLDTTTGEWTNVSTVAVPALTDHDAFAMLNNRLLYIHQDSATTELLTLLNISDPADVRVMSDDTAIPDEGPGTNTVGLIAHPFDTNPGGTATLVRQVFSSCGPTMGPDGGTGPDACDINLMNANISAGGTAPTLETAPGQTVGQIAQVGGAVGFASDRVNNFDILVFPAISISGGNPEATLRRFTIPLHTPTGSPLTFSLADPRMSWADLDPCNDVVFTANAAIAAGSDPPTLFAAPLRSGGTGASAAIGQAGQKVYFEPFERLVIRPVSNATNPQIFAEGYGGDATDPTLPGREWNTGGINPTAVAVRSWDSNDGPPNCP